MTLITLAAAAGLSSREGLARAFGFSEGLRPVVTAPAGTAPWKTAAECGACHENALRDWRASRHAQAFSNTAFQAGFAREPVLRCVHCHAPRAEQAQDVARHLPRAPFAKRRVVLEREGLHVPSSSPAHDGVDCFACHVRDGVAWTRGETGEAAHLQREAAAALASPDFCAGCHQFRFHQLQAGRVVLEELPIQKTWDEWRAYAGDGGEGTCQSCHMKANAHALLGSRDAAFMRAALQVELGGGAARLRSVGVGHHCPTGDVFRHLTVETQAREGGWTRLAWLGRRYEARTAPGERHPRTELIEDTALRPGEVRVLPLPPGTTRLRVRYHYVPEDESALAPEDLPLTLYDEITPAR